MPTPGIRRKLIEVSIPLEAINKASAREKSIRHGHPSTLHLWWARRPLAACRAVLFAQLVDDPSSWPDRFPTEEAQEVERLRLHRVIEEIVEWPSESKKGDRERFDRAIEAARYEIARSFAWGLGEEPPPRGDAKAILAWLQEKAPPVYDPFCGGGSIPLEAQRLGLRAYGSDLNPVAVLISKALVEIPPKFAARPPVNLDARAKLKRSGGWHGRGAEGLADDVRYYGQWMRDEAEKRIGHLYPKAKLTDGTEVTVIAWLWARTVRSPDPAAKGAVVPLVSSFMLSTREGKKAWVETVIDPAAPDGWRFEVKTGALTKVEEDEKKKGTKTGRGTNFACVLTGSAISPDHTRAEGNAGRLGARLMAVVAEGNRKRIYLSPTIEQERRAAEAKPSDTSAIEVEMPDNPRWFSPPGYGMKRYVDIFTPRQLVALTTFSDLVAEAREKVLADARAAGLSDPPGDPADPTSPARLHAGGTGAAAYADAVATYLGLIVGRCSDAWSSITSWASTGGFIRNTFARQALPMVWDFSEGNPFSASTGNFTNNVEWTSLALAGAGALGAGAVEQVTAQENNHPIRPVLISTDPPYYDNIGYADLSDFFYVWHKRTLSNVWPALYRRLTVPKDAELVATPYRHGGRDQAEAFFIKGMSEALEALRDVSTDSEPLAVYYAFKQAEASEEGVNSPGWSSFLQAVVSAGLAIDGTWPVRTERQSRTIGVGTNALASSIILVCRKRAASAGSTDRAGFSAALRRELPDAIAKIRTAGVGPVDMQQSVIGPGMGIFTRYSEVLEDDDSAMTVKTALSIINRVWEEIDNELIASLDPETQVALAWFGSYGFDAKQSGELITLANAKNTAINALFASGVFLDLHGKAALTPREKLPAGWRPSTDRHLTIWECVQHTARALNDADAGGLDAAAQLVAEMGAQATDARALLDRLFRIATDKGWAAEALVCNQLAEEWPHLLERARTPEAAPARPATGDLFTQT